jgi:hypothetical protein
VLDVLLLLLLLLAVVLQRGKVGEGVGRAKACSAG